MPNVYLMIAIAAVANVATVYFMKLSAGLTVPWPIFGMLVANLFTNWFLGRAFAGGAPVGIDARVVKGRIGRAKSEILKQPGLLQIHAKFPTVAAPGRRDIGLDAPVQKLPG